MQLIVSPSLGIPSLPVADPFEAHKNVPCEPANELVPTSSGRQKMRWGLNIIALSRVESVLAPSYGLEERAPALTDG